jgi:hypothetical protein
MRDDPERDPNELALQVHFYYKKKHYAKGTLLTERDARKPEKVTAAIKRLASGLELTLAHHFGILTVAERERRDHER